MNRWPGARWSAAVLFALSIPLIFFRLGTYSVVNGDEAFYHYVARHMVETGNWLRLEFTGEHHVYETFMNAPLQYWARAVLIALFGDSNWTMRLLSAVFAVLSVLMTFRLVAHISTVRAGLVAGLIQLTTFQFLYMHSARTGELEPIVCFLLTLTAYLFLRALETGRSFVPHHLCLIALANVKLPLLVVPVAAELAYFASARPGWRRFRSWAAGGTLVALGLAWHVAQYLSLGEEARQMFARMGNQASGDALQRAHSMSGNAVFYARTLIFGAFPYALIYPVAIAGLIATGWRRGLGAGIQLLLLYPAAVYGFFIVVAKFYPWYIIPVYPFASGLVAIWLDRVVEERRSASLLASAALVFGLAVWVGVGNYNPFAVRALEPLPYLLSWRELAGIGPVLGVPLVVLVIAAALALVWRASGPRFVRPVSLLFLSVLVAVGSYRVVFPLRYTQHRSQMEALREQIDRDRAAGPAARLSHLGDGAWRTPRALFLRRRVSNRTRSPRPRQRRLFSAGRGEELTLQLNRPGGGAGPRRGGEPARRSPLRRNDACERSRSARVRPSCSSSRTPRPSLRRASPRRLGRRPIR